jgi:hypothetical protein
MIVHCGTDRSKRTATTFHSLKMKGELKVCEDCAVAKARQKNITQDWKEGSHAPGDHLEISSIRDKNYGGSCFWVLMLDDYTDYCWSNFLKTKGDLKVKVMTLLTDLKTAGVEVKIIRYNDSRENQALHEECQAKGYGIKFEFLGPKILSVMVRLKESFKPSLEELEL